MLDGNWRNIVDRGLSPIGKNLHRAGITADVVTIIGILMAVAASISVASGSLRLGFVLLVMTGRDSSPSRARLPLLQLRNLRRTPNVLLD